MLSPQGKKRLEGAYKYSWLLGRGARALAGVGGYGVYAGTDFQILMDVEGCEWAGTSEYKEEACVCVWTKVTERWRRRSGKRLMREQLCRKIQLPVPIFLGLPLPRQPAGVRGRFPSMHSPSRPPPFQLWLEQVLPAKALSGTLFDNLFPNILVSHQRGRWPPAVSRERVGGAAAPEEPPEHCEKQEGEQDPVEPHNCCDFSPRNAPESWAAL